MRFRSSPWWASHIATTSGRVEVKVPVSKGSSGAFASCWLITPAMTAVCVRWTRSRSASGRPKDDEELPGHPLELGRRSVCALGGNESGDGPPEHERCVRGVLDGPAHERGLRREQVRHEVATVARFLDGPHRGEEVAPAALEEGVVEGVLPVEVDIERRGPEAHPPGDLAERQAGHTLLGHDLDGDVEHLLDRLLPAALPAVGRHSPRHGGECSPNAVRTSTGS
jgi:hypothetical protein